MSAFDEANSVERETDRLRPASDIAVALLVGAASGFAATVAGVVIAFCAFVVFRAL